MIPISSSMPFVWNNRALNDAALTLRSKLAEKRGAGNRADATVSDVMGLRADADIPVLTDAESGPIAPVRAVSAQEEIPVLTDRVSQSVANLVPERTLAVKWALSAAISKLEKELEIVDGKVADLMKKYAVTESVVAEATAVLAKADPRDFVRESYVPNVDSGHALEIGLEDFPVFRILKIVPTETRGSVVDTVSWTVLTYERSICLVFIQSKSGKKGKRELLVTFPLAPGEELTCHDPKTQKLLMKKEILSVSVNRKTLKERLISLF